MGFDVDLWMSLQDREENPLTLLSEPTTMTINGGVTEFTAFIGAKTLETARAHFGFAELDKVYLENNIGDGEVEI